METFHNCKVNRRQHPQQPTKLLQLSPWSPKCLRPRVSFQVVIMVPACIWCLSCCYKCLTRSNLGRKSYCASWWDAVLCGEQGIVEFYSLRVPHSSADTDRLASPSPLFVPSGMPAYGMVLHTVRGVIPQSKPLWKQLHRHIWK